MADRIRTKLQALPWLVAERDGKVIAFAYAAPHRSRSAYRWSVDVSVYVEASAHREGVGRALYEVLLGALQLQGFCNVYAGITLPNSASVGFHEAIGFEPVGVYRSVGYKLGSWHDVGWWGKVIQAHPVDPQELRPIGELCESEEFHRLLADASRMSGPSSPTSPR